MKAKKPIRLKVASPCTADWNAMTGDDAVRHCGSCNKSVYQLSNMSTEQVEALLTRSGEATCGRFYQRKDGTLLTEDCVVGLRRKRRKQAVVGAGMGVLSVLGVAMGASGPTTPGTVDPPTQLIEAAPGVDPVGPAPAPAPPPPVQIEPEPDIEEYEIMMGDVAYEPEVPDEGVREPGSTRMLQ